MRPALPLLLAFVLGVAAAGLVACGSDDGARRKLIPERGAERLKGALSDVDQAVADGDCEGAASALNRARAAIAGFPRAVDNRLVARLREGVANLETIAPRECADQQETTATTETAPTTTTTPETTATTATTDTTPTPTTTTATTTTTTTTTTTAPPTTTTTTTAPTTPPANTTGGATTP